MPSKRSCFPKKCDFPLCKNSARSRGFCYSHGGGRRCRVEGCNNGAVSRDLCKRHGGGRRCRIVNCKSSAESGGLCYSHGGGRRCRLSGCSARVKKGGLCVIHLTGGTRPGSLSGGADTLLTDTSSEGSDVVETLLALAKEQPLEGKMGFCGDWRGGSAAQSAYAITSLLN
uniref:WRKY19-like zinc finger domain-containing protein n=1 Tax=Hyaloperonospora arabidopsidis (strain Emoy2) TaxID=559515 RepID=M4BBA8_HYAAE